MVLEVERIEKRELLEISHLILENEIVNWY